MARIFLCHASEDKPQVREVYQRLKALGFEPWFDEEELLPGQDWAYEIPRALEASEFILIFFSNNSVTKRGYVQREMKLALDAWQEIPQGRIHTIPVCLDECDIPDQFRRYHYASLFDLGGFDRLVAAIHRGLEQRGEQISDLLEAPPVNYKGKQRRQKSTSETAMTRRTTIRAAIVGAMAIVVGAVLATALTGYFPWQPKPKPIPPIFTPVTPVINPNIKALILTAGNASARRQGTLDVEFDGLVYAGRGVPVDHPTGIAWELAFSDFLPSQKRVDGRHTLRLRFLDQPFSESLTIEFFSRDPNVRVVLMSDPDNPQSKNIFGVASSDRQDPEERMQVDIVLHHEAEPIRVPLSVTRIVDDRTGHVHFEFDFKIEDILKIPADDPRFGKPYFGFWVTDQAGNQYYNILSYSQFIAIGENHFGVGPSQVSMQASQPSETSRAFRFHFAPKPPVAKMTYKGADALQLRVYARAANINRLEWDNLPLDIRSPDATTLVLRNGQLLSATYSNGYIDNAVVLDKQITYQIQQMGRDGIKYGSEVVTSPFPPERLQGLNGQADLTPPMSDPPVVESRLALIIGNGAYSKEAALKTPPNDARLMADTLRALSFQLFGDRVHIDVTQTQMRRLIRDFTNEIDKQSVGLFYYSGHGMQVDNRNYILPIDAEIEDRVDVRVQGTSLDEEVLWRMRNADPIISIILIDASRNNPFEKKGASIIELSPPNELLRKASWTEQLNNEIINKLGVHVPSLKVANAVIMAGLASRSAAIGSIIGFASEPNTVAYESKGKYSYFTEALAREILKPGIPITQVLRHVRRAVHDATNGKQIPVFTEALLYDFYLLPVNGPTRIKEKRP